MKTRKYEQPTLELVSLAANDILLTAATRMTRFRVTSARRIAAQELN